MALRPKSGLLPALLAGASLAAGCAAAEGLLGRAVTFHVETWDNPDAWLNPEWSTETIAGTGVDFDIDALTNGEVMLIPVTVDIGAQRIDISFENAGSWAFLEAKFNGYVLSFASDCTLFVGVKIDEETTTLPLEPQDVTVTPRSVRINVSGIAFVPSDRIGVIFDATPCLLG